MPHVAEAVGTIPGSQEAVSTNAIHWDPLVNDISDTIPRYFCNPETAGQHPTQECRGGRRLRSRRDVSVTSCRASTNSKRCSRAQTCRDVDFITIN